MFEQISIGGDNREILPSTRLFTRFSKSDYLIEYVTYKVASITATYVRYYIDQVALLLKNKQAF